MTALAISHPAMISKMSGAPFFTITITAPRALRASRRFRSWPALGHTNLGRRRHGRGPTGELAVLAAPPAPGMHASMRSAPAIRGAALTCALLPLDFARGCLSPPRHREAAAPATAPDLPA
jgi:hypothetical protein